MIKKPVIAFFLITLLMMQCTVVAALTDSEAKQVWKDTKKISLEKQEIHFDAKIKLAGNNSEENRQEVVDTGKDVLYAALDEADAWLVWKDLEARSNPDLPDDLKDTIHEDVETNHAKIDELRTDVDGIENRLQLGLVYLKMVGKYVELITDVARDSGKILVYIGDTQIDKAEDIESKLRAEAGNMDGNDEIIEKLDLAKADLNEARSNVNKAEDSYNQVVLPGTPLIKFKQGNNYLRVAKTNLISAQSNLNQAYTLMLGR